MSIKDMKKEEIELLSNKDITNLLLEEKGCQNTAELFTQIIELLDLPKSTFDNKIGDYFTALTTDKRFLMLEDGTWDLRSRHNASKVIKVIEEDDDELEDVSNEEDIPEEDEFDIDSVTDDDDTFDDNDDDLKDLVILDEDELELEQ